MVMKSKRRFVLKMASSSPSKFKLLRPTLQRANAAQASSRSHDATCSFAQYTDRSFRLQRRCQ
jgi:hypothetical protein